jgi:hypothetical protein
MAKLSPKNCPKCSEKHEKCADNQKCPSWRTSYEVCIIFGTRPFRLGFRGAAASSL